MIRWITANIASIGPSPVAASVTSSPFVSISDTVAVGTPHVPATTCTFLSLKICSTVSNCSSTIASKSSS